MLELALAQMITTASRLRKDQFLSSTLGHLREKGQGHRLVMTEALGFYRRPAGKEEVETLDNICNLS